MFLQPGMGQQGGAPVSQLQARLTGAGMPQQQMMGGNMGGQRMGMVNRVSDPPNVLDRLLFTHLPFFR